jgi:hypothetical protein
LAGAFVVVHLLFFAVWNYSIIGSSGFQADVKGESNEKGNFNHGTAKTLGEGAVNTAIMADATKAGVQRIEKEPQP